MDLDRVITAFASELIVVDSARPQWTTSSGRVYKPGIGPFPEDEVVRRVVGQMRATEPRAFAQAKPVPYPDPDPSLKCDLGIGDPLDWVIEVKMARAMGNNGLLDDTSTKDLLSPYSDDRSALTDAAKLRSSGFACRMAILVYAFDYEKRPVDLVLDALETLLRAQGPIGLRTTAEFAGLVHPVHKSGRVVAWEVLRSAA